MRTNAAQARDIVHFWLGDSVKGSEHALAQHDRWYRGGADLDAEIEDRFGDYVVQACEGALEAWQQTPQGTLALVLLLDQFTRSIYRGSPRAYLGDPLALIIADRAVSAGHDRQLPPPGRVFLYHPFHHSEVLADQNRGVALLEAMEQAVPPQWCEYVSRAIAGFGRHRDIVARFGRFPHRNRILGRTSTAEELAYMEAGGDTFGQE